MSNRFLGGHVSAAGGPSKAIQRSVDIGANSLQIFAGSPRSWARSLYSQNEIEKYKQQKNQFIAGPLFIHALYLINLASADQDNLKKSIDSLVMDLKNGDLLGCSGVVVHIGSHLGLGFEKVQEQLVRVIKEVLDQTKSTPLLLENTSGQKGKIGTLDDLTSLISSIDNHRLGICLDTAHLFESGVDLREKSQIDNYLLDLKNRHLLDRVKLIHLNDSKTALGSTKDEHENIGDGQIGEVGLKNFITHPLLTGTPIILEVPGIKGDGPDRENIDIVKSLLQ